MGLGNANAGTVEVDVEGDFRQFNRDLDKRGSKAGGKFGSSFSSSFGSKIAGIGAAYLGTNFLRGTINEASDLAESVNVTGLAFGDARAEADEFAKGAADAIGMSESEARAAQAQIGNILGGYGLAADQAEEISRGMITRAADIGSAWNAGTDEVSAAIQSALVGSTEPLRKFGVIIDQAGIKQKALEMGLADTAEEVDNQAKALAVNALIMEQTDNVAGDFKNTQDGLANSSKTVGAMWKDMQAQLGQALLPLLESLLKVVRALGPDGMKMVLMLGAAAFAFVKVAQAARAFGAALTLLSANPWVLAALAIIAVGVAIWRNWDTIKEKLGQAWEFLTTKLGELAGWFEEKWAQIGVAWDTFKQKVSDVTSAIGGFVQRWLIDPVNRFIDIVTGLPARAGQAWDTIKTKIGEAAEWIKRKLGELADAADRALGPIDEIVGGAAGLIGRGAGLLGFDSGGVVPGPRGAPRLIMAHAGETILPTHKQSIDSAAMAAGIDGLERAGGGNTYIDLTVNANGLTSPEEAAAALGEPMARELDRRLRREQRANGRPEEAIR